MTLVWIGLGGAAGVFAGFWFAHRRGSRRVASAETELAESGKELARRLSELFALQELSYILAESVSVERIAEQVSAYLSRFAHALGTLVLLMRDGSGELRVVAASGTLKELAGKVSGRADAGLVTKAIGAGRIETSSAETDIALLADFRWSGAAAALPLKVHGRTLGALAVVKSSEDRFADSDYRLLSLVATHTAMALSNARFVDQIRVGKEQWEATFDAMRAGIAVIDGEGRIRRANTSIAKLLGLSLPDLIDQALLPLLLPESEAFAAAIAEARTGARPAPLTSRSQALDRILEISVSSMGGETPEWVVVLVEDVTTQKALEASVIQSEKMAAVGQLVSGVAHELNNPLTSISGLAEFLLQQSAGNTAQREHLQVVREQAERAAEIVRNLLTFARKGPAQSEDVDLNDVARRTIALTEYEMQLRGIELTAELEDGLPAVHGDRYQLQQVVLNLLTNAAQAVADNAPDKPRLVAIRTAVEGDSVVIRVADSGPGIPPESVAKLFEPFYTTKDLGQGTGLGLSITYGIVRGHGGTIEIEHPPEDGAAFVVTLPASVGRASTTITGDLPEARNAPGDTDVRSHRHRILLVDDDLAVRRMIGIVFSHEGSEVEEVPDATAGVVALSEHRYDLILADARAAISAGETFADWLCREHPQLRPRTIFLTADVRPETDAWLQGLGCRYFQKPFNVQELREAANKILHTGR